MSEAPVMRDDARTVGSHVRSFLRDEAGATSIEYALIAVGIGVAIAGSVNLLGTSIDDLFVVVQGLF